MFHIAPEENVGVGRTRPVAEPGRTRPVAEPGRTRSVAEPGRTRPVAEPGRTRPVAEPAWFEVSGRRYVVHVPDPDTRRTVTGLFPAYVADCGADAQVAFHIERDGLGFSLIAPDGQPVPVPSAPELVGQLEFGLTEAFLAGCANRIHLHASGCVVGGAGVLALGRSGAGKSSLAAYWLLSGAPVLGDDVVFLDEDGYVLPFKRQFKVDPELLRRLGAQPEHTPFWQDDAAEAWLDPGDGWAAPAPLAVVAAVRYVPGIDLEVREMSRRDAANTLVHSGLDTGLQGAARFEGLVAAVQGAAVLEVRFGDAAAAGAYLMALCRR